MANTNSSNRKKRTSNSNGGSSNKKNKNYQTKEMIIESEKVKSEITVLISSLIAIMLFLCNFGVIGPIGNFISDMMFGVFGIFAYVLPILVVLAILFKTSNHDNPVATRKLIFGVVLLTFIGMALSLFSGIVDEMLDVKEGFAFYAEIFYVESAENRFGGALFELMLFYQLKLFDYVGTILILTIGILVSIVFLTKKSVVKGIKNGGKYAYESAKKEVEKKRETLKERARIKADELREERINRENSVDSSEDVKGQEEVSEEAAREERKRKREQKVVGVTMDTTLTAPTANECIYDVHEIEYSKEKMVDYENNQYQQNFAANNDVSTNNYKNEATTVKKPFASADRVQVNRTNANKTETKPISRRSQSAREYKFPPISLLKQSRNNINDNSKNTLHETARKLQEILLTFGVKVTITDISQGPSVTRYELQPELGVKVSKIVGLADDIKLNLAATDIRIEAPIPGKAAIGIEVPNKDNSLVSFRELIENNNFKNFDSSIAFAVGKDIAGKVIVSDIAKMPHMLIAGATGSGKSVCINTLIMSILYKAHPEDVKLIMIDPKVVELSVYNGIPHLMIPVVTEPKKAAAALHWGVAEMTDRYKKFADFNVRDLKGYNNKVKEVNATSSEKLDILPQIVIIVDELADLMMVAPGEVEESICRLAQLARAAGIHLIIATQRPSVDVITGLIKANMPSRVAFAVSSGIDSRTILDMNGAEKLLGKGDMLFYPQGYSKPARVQGAFVSDGEVSDVVTFLKNQMIGNVYNEEISSQINEAATVENTAGGKNIEDDARDVYFADAARVIIEKEKASIGMLQRVFKIGFNRAARIMDQLAEEGIVGEEEGTKPRKVNMTMQEFEDYINQ